MFINKCFIAPVVKCCFTNVFYFVFYIVFFPFFFLFLSLFIFFFIFPFLPFFFPCFPFFYLFLFSFLFFLQNVFTHSSYTAWRLHRPRKAFSCLWFSFISFVLAGAWLSAAWASGCARNSPTGPNTRRLKTPSTWSVSLWRSVPAPSCCLLQTPCSLKLRAVI